MNENDAPDITTGPVIVPAGAATTAGLARGLAATAAGKAGKVVFPDIATLEAAEIGPEIIFFTRNHAEFNYHHSNLTHPCMIVELSLKEPL